MRLNWLPHGFTPASLRCLCTMDRESLGKALQDCLRALGTGQGADHPAAPAPQAAAAPPAPPLAHNFPLKEELVVHNTCNPDTTLAPETPEWWWLADVTPKYVFRRAMTLWMKKHGGHSAGHGPRFFLKAPVELPPGWFDESEVQWYTATPSSMPAMGATISGGGKHKKDKASAATAAEAPTAMAPSPFVQPSVVQAIQGVQQVCSSSTVVSAGSTVRLNRLHRPCTVERHLPTH